MTEVIVKTGAIQVVSTKLTKNLIKQFRKLDHIPQEWTTRVDPLQPFSPYKINHQNVLGWIHSTVLGDNHISLILIESKGIGQGNDYFLFNPKNPSQIMKEYPQIYIV